jgi:hypothetical protein
MNVTLMASKPGTSLFVRGPIWISYSGGIDDFERINTSTRRTSSGDSFPEVSVGVCAWHPRTYPGAASVRAKIRARNGFTTVGTIPRLSHAEAVFMPQPPPTTATDKA